MLATAPVRLTVSVALVLAAAACGDDPADVAGPFTIALTNRDNGCDLGNWTVGATTTGVLVQITQSGSAASADVNGLAGSALDFVLGGHVYTGSVDGADLDLAITGTQARSQGACAYTFNSTLAGELTGDSLNGSVVYQAQTNGAADCATLTGCTSRQDFAGARPPQ